MKTNNTENRYDKAVLLRRKDAARMLGVSIMHISNLVDTGQLQAIDMATKGARRSLRIPITELNRFLNNRLLQG